MPIVLPNVDYSRVAKPVMGPLDSDLEILNYALTLEHLEAALYRDAINSGMLQGNILNTFRVIGDHESAHVTGLTQVIQQLGGTPVQAQSVYYRPRFANVSEMVTFFQAVEEVGAGAYLGAAASIRSKQLLVAAVGIHNVEGQHAAILADYLGIQASPVIASPFTPEEVLKAVTPLLQGSAAPTTPPRTGDGGGEEDQDRRTLD